MAVCIANLVWPSLNYVFVVQLSRPESQTDTRASQTLHCLLSRLSAIRAPHCRLSNAIAVECYCEHVAHDTQTIAIVPLNWKLKDYSHICLFVCLLSLLFAMMAGECGSSYISFFLYVNGMPLGAYIYISVYLMYELQPIVRHGISADLTYCSCTLHTFQC